MSKRNKISFQRYVHDLWLILGLFFFFFFCAFSICRNVFLLVLGGTYNVHTSLSCANINCYYGHYAAIMTKKYICHFSTTTFTTPWWWEKITFYPTANCYYVHCVVIMSSWQKYVFISALRVLHLDHDKKYTFFSFQL